MSDDRRHWHGTSGDRHEHHNVWTAGGAKGPTSRAPWALTPEMMANLNARKVFPSHSNFPVPLLPSLPDLPIPNSNANTLKNSDASTSSTKDATANPVSPSVPSINDRRRSSASSGSGAGLFSNLQSQKRDSGDASMAGRRASWNEQQKPGGWFGKLWDGYTKGN